MKKYLILGSGGYVKEWWKENATKYLTEGYTLCAINNAWKVEPKLLKVWFRSEDYYDVPTTVKPQDEDRERWQEVVQMLTYPFYYTKVGGSGTILPNVLCHVMNEHFHAKTPYWICLAGCDCVYKGDGKDWFYGQGQPDPMRFGKERLHDTLTMLKQLSEQQGGSILNVGGQAETLLPFARFKL